MSLTSEYRHIPVLLDEVLEALDLHEGDTFVDCTLGGAGHSREVEARIAPSGLLIGIDQDQAALDAAAEQLSAIAPHMQPLLLRGNFGDLDELLITAEVPGIDAILFDLGVSSPQLDFHERGFSYHGDARLDMRMDPGKHTKTAAEVINTYDVADLTRIFRDYGEERWASRIAQFVVKARATSKIETADQLVAIVKDAIPASARRKGGHPARRTFQALRIEVNQELDMLRQGLDAAVRWLLPGGRIVVISYHSLEDRIVKECFSRLSQGCTCPPDLPVCVCGNKPVLQIMTRKPIMAGDEEVERNPRARSARMRVARKLDQDGR
ncbi:MAG: 16S rRNA (cytosine(1402)-N(4))-methyltransferase RsmH [Coriobacteriales bacterium]|jgi:16S rRNA (cytosine1402-N4)-methyltransferase|nr:16S rRNA (cytosine(1402)-N(4))-methyltransferase RsmH [Coriobacteriales bacterium]